MNRVALIVECRDTDMSAMNGKGTWKTTCDHADGEIKLDVSFSGC